MLIQSSALLRLLVWNKHWRVKSQAFFNLTHFSPQLRLISIMLGRLRMSTGDALEKYRLISKEVFHKDLRQWGWQLKLLTKYPAHKIESVIRSIVRERTPEKSREIEKTVFSQMPSPSDLCKVLVSIDTR